MQLNPKTNLLSQHAHRYVLQDVAEPNLCRDIYNYDEVPKIPFNGRTVPYDMPEEIYITDTTFRDGQQSLARPYTTEEIVNIYKMLSELGGKKGLIRTSEFFVYSKKDKEALRKCQELGLEFPKITTWIRASKEDFKLVRDLGVSETGILVSCSDYHIFKKLGMTRKQAMNHYLSVISDSFEQGIIPRCHLEDITRADFYGFVVPFVNELMKMSEDAKIPVKIRACDTMGYGIPFREVALPRSVGGMIYGLKHFCGVEADNLEWHGHNDFYLGVSNAMTAWLYGASGVNCSLFGIGERCGNVPLEAMVMQYAQLRGGFDGMNPEVITKIASYYENEIGYKIPPMTPFVGESFNVTRAGIHADGLMKDEEIYNIFNTKKILGVSPKVLIGKNSGLSGVAYWLNSFYDLKGEEEIGKRDEVCQFMKAYIDEEYADGRVTNFSNSELMALANRFDKEKFPLK